MKLDKDPFPLNMTMIKLDGKKVLVWPSQAESTKGKDIIIIGEEWPSRMIKSKSPKVGQWQKNEWGKTQQCPKAIFDILMAKHKEGRAGVRGRKT
jgi:GH43 family beta-xylosidase